MGNDSEERMGDVVLAVPQPLDLGRDNLSLKLPFPYSFPSSDQAVLWGRLYLQGFDLSGGL